MARLQAAAGAAARRCRAHGAITLPCPRVLAQADAERRDGGGMRTVIRILDSDPGDPLAAALARLGRAMQSAKSSVIYRTARHAKKHSLTYYLSKIRMT